MKNTVDLTFRINGKEETFTWIPGTHFLYKGKNGDVFEFMFPKSPNSKRYELDKRKTEALESIDRAINVLHTTGNEFKLSQHLKEAKQSLSEEDVRRIVREEIFAVVKVDSLHPDYVYNI